MPSTRLPISDYRRFGRYLLPFLLLFPLPSLSISQTCQLDHLTILTGNLDSLTKAYAMAGYDVESKARDPFGISQNIVRFPSGQFILLESTFSTDSNDWQQQALTAYGTHVSGVTLSVSNAAALYLRFDSLNIPHGQLEPSRTSTGGIRLGFGIAGPSPIDVNFVSQDLDTTSTTSDSLPPNRLSRITWLLFTASPNEEQLLRQVFSALALPLHHEGCCDYWLIGPANDRVGLRFELPTTTFAAEGDWLSIEDGGIVTNY